MLLTIVVSLTWTRNSVVVRIVATVRICDFMTITMITHKSMNIRLIMREIDRCRTMVTRWEMIPIPRRFPRLIMRRTQVSKDDRSRDIDRLNIIIRSINIWCTYDLYSCSRIRHDIGNKGSHILVHVCRQDSLNEEDMVVSFQNL